MIDAVLHALERLERDDRYVPDGVALLQPTSPLRSVDTIRRGIELFRGHGGASVVAVSRARSHPLWSTRIDVNGRLRPFVPGVDIPEARQELPPAYCVNGCLYVGSREVLLQERAFGISSAYALVVDEEEGLDIDTPSHWGTVQWLWRAREAGRGSHPR